MNAVPQWELKRKAQRMRRKRRKRCGDLKKVLRPDSSWTQSGDLETDVQSKLNLWRENCSSQLNSIENGTPEDSIPDCPQSMMMEQNYHIQTVKVFEYQFVTWETTKSNDLLDWGPSYSKNAGKGLTRCLHQLFCKIWSDKSRPGFQMFSVVAT